jgi:fructokinase
MSEKRYAVVGLGELLWDVFPAGKELGGAPANFAYMTSLLGDEGVVASRVGQDELGDEAIHRLEHLGLSTSYLQLDSSCRTGTASVEVDSNGQPTFKFANPSAWDCFEWTPAWQILAQQADAVCFGTLAQRSPQSRQAIHSFLKTIHPETTRIFDVNLRQSFYSSQILADSANLADIIKLNHDELPRVVQLLGFPFHDEESAAEWLLNTFHIKLVCITRGAEGSLLVSEYAKHEHPGIRVSVADTVGSGDAFTAALVYHYLRRDSLATMNEAANRMGSWVASQTGATPAADEARLKQIRAAAE